MFNLSKFIGQYVTKRETSMFAQDIEANKEKLSAEIKGQKVCVIGGAGSIGSSFIKAVLRFEPKSVVVVDLNENGLAELVRDVRSTEGLYVPDEFRCSGWRGTHPCPDPQPGSRSSACRARPRSG